MMNKKFLILVLILIILICVTIKREKYENTFTLYKAWYSDNKQTLDTFDYLFNDVKNKYNNAFLYTYNYLPEEPRDKNNLYVQYSGESWYADPKQFDINFVPEIPTSENKNVIFLYGLLSLIERNINVDKLLEKRQYKQNKKFCIFCVSNGNSEPRNNFFTQLSKYKKVDSCGKHFNNMDGFICPGDHGTSEYYEFISNYKFMICFENTLKDYYFTEKLLNAYLNNTIPIYWGCPNLPEFINMNAIFYLKPDYTEQDVTNLINEIIKVDQNEELYRAKFEQPLFVDNKLPDLFSLEKIRENVNKILLK